MPAGRPPLHPALRRSRNLQVRLTELEELVLRKLAAGEPLSDAARALIHESPRFLEALARLSEKLQLDSPREGE